ncbi:methionine ABC transporter ATP-binding protein [Bosea sp. Root670]|uniref:methionine ABC transporter ATP-binding protein n=1 Tax=Bosea sp. Root670 TaxID=1736583 RepID=UPI0009E78532
MNAPVRPGTLSAGVSSVSLPLSLPEPAIRFERVGKTYPGRRGQQPVGALAGIDLDVPAGTILGVIGRSGAGKSTLIRLVNGLERATEGRILIEGTDVTGLTESGWRQQRRRIGMIFQHFNLLSSRTVFDNVALPLEIAGAGKAEITAKVERLLALVGLSDKSARYPAELSGGQKQRVGIARALATDPKVLLCDEATSALDPETTRSILALLRQVNRELGITILLITHEIPVIKEICDRVAVIEGGQIVEQGETFAVFTNPQHPTTASFVETVTGVELPEHLAHRVRKEARPGDNIVLRITFLGENATAPVISRLSAIVGVDVNILAGRIDAIAGQPFGSLLVSVPSRAPESDAVLGALRSLGLKAEVIGHVS